MYCLYDESFSLVYIGQAGGKNDQRLFQILRQHREDALSERWSRVSWFGTRRVSKNYVLNSENKAIHTETGMVLNHIEAILIAAAEPIHNRQRGKFGTGVGQYLDAENIGPTSEEMIQDMWERSKEA